MHTLKVAFYYLLAFVVTIPGLSIIEFYTGWLISPYETWSDIAFGAAYFTVLFTLFDRFILRKIISDHSS